MKLFMILKSVDSIIFNRFFAWLFFYSKIVKTSPKITLKFTDANILFFIAFFRYPQLRISQVFALNKKKTFLEEMSHFTLFILQWLK